MADVKRFKKKALAKPQMNIQSDRGGVPSMVAQKLASEFEKNDNVTIVHDYEATEPIVGWVSTNAFLLDLAIGFPKNYGIPQPSIIEIVGSESTGKSSLTYAIIGNTQRAPHNGWGQVVDVESAFTKEYGHLARMAMGKDMFGYAQASRLEDVIKLMQRSIEHSFALAPDMAFTTACDSLASTTVEEEVAVDGHTSRAPHSRILARGVRSGLLPNLYMKVQTNGGTELLGRPLIIIFVNQLKATMNTIPGAQTLDSFGGKTLKYHSRIRLKLSLVGTIKDKKDEMPVGKRFKVEVIKNKIASPGRTAEFDFRFATGVEDYEPVMEFLAAHDAIEMNGKRYCWDGKSYWTADFRELLRDNEKAWLYMQAQCVKVAEKYWVDRSLPSIDEIESDEETSPEIKTKKTKLIVED